MNLNMIDREYQNRIVKEFIKINYEDGIKLIDEIIHKHYNDLFIKEIIISLTKNKKIQTYIIYEYLIKNIDIDINTNLVAFMCVEYKNSTFFKYLNNQKKIDINSTNQYNNTLLMIASTNVDRDMIHYLLKNGANKTINNRNMFGETALTCLLRSSVYNNKLLTRKTASYIDALELLLNNGSDINLVYCETGHNILMHAIRQYLPVNVIKLFLMHGVDINFVNKKYNITALDLAKRSYKKYIKTLLKFNGKSACDL